MVKILRQTLAQASLVYSLCERSRKGGTESRIDAPEWSGWHVSCPSRSKDPPFTFIFPPATPEEVMHWTNDVSSRTYSRQLAPGEPAHPSRTFLPYSPYSITSPPELTRASPRAIRHVGSIPGIEEYTPQRPQPRADNSQTGRDSEAWIIVTGRPALWRASMNWVNPGGFIAGHESSCSSGSNSVGDFPSPV
jgi:hypothetical protein